jgi:AraC family transcriptional regulator
MDNRRQKAKAPPRPAGLPVNPPGTLIGEENVVLTGSNNRYFVPEFEGCLSIKTVVRGSALWEAGGRTFKVHENCYLTLNDRQRYTLTIDSLQNATTFCLFFERGFVEDVLRATITPAAALLDAPRPARQISLPFAEKLEPGDDRVMAMVRNLNARIASGPMMRSEWDERFLHIGALLIWEHQNAAAAVAKLPVARAATRSELYRRLLRGRDFLLSSLDTRVRLKEAAREACLSPYHFHRAFRQVFGETPHGFLLRQRLGRAASLLRRRDLSVTDVCLETGFESLPSFSTLFRRHFGVAPRDFRGTGSPFIPVGDATKIRKIE